jgi:hypothetical protein
VDILAMMRSGRYDLSSLVTHEHQVDDIGGGPGDGRERESSAEGLHQLLRSSTKSGISNHDRS